MNKKLKVAIRVGIISLACAALVVGYFIYLNKKNSKTEEPDKQLTETEIIETTDFDKNYPETPRAVVKWYNRIAAVIYNNDLGDVKLEAVGEQERKLLDDDLLKLNPEKDFYNNLEKEMKENEERKRTIVSSEVSESADVTYKTVAGYECAYVYAYYFGKEGNNFTRTYQKFCLRKGKQGRWKILTFEKVPREETSFQE